MGGPTPRSADLALFSVLPDYPGERPSVQLGQVFGGPYRAIPLGAYVDRAFVSGRVASVTYNPVFGVDLAAIAIG